MALFGFGWLVSRGEGCLSRNDAPTRQLSDETAACFGSIVCASTGVCLTAVARAFSWHRTSSRRMSLDNLCVCVSGNRSHISKRRRARSRGRAQPILDNAGGTVFSFSTGTHATHAIPCKSKSNAVHLASAGARVLTRPWEFAIPPPPCARYPLPPPPSSSTKSPPFTRTFPGVIDTR